MIRPIMGLTLACLLVGCGRTATEPSTTTESDATTTAVADTGVADAGSDVAAATNTSDATHTVVFKVPGMT